MTETIRVLGIDLACRSWRDNGSAVLEFQPGENPAWVAVRPSAIVWPQAPLSPSPQGLANHILQFVTENKIHAISLDGPQGWRDPFPEPATRPGVGRWCEYLAHCPAKAGGFGVTYPAAQMGWFEFCVELFAALRANPLIALAEIPGANESTRLPPQPDRPYLLETFPTSTWRTSGLRPLPDKGRVGGNRAVLRAYAQRLFECFGLPAGDGWVGTHDDLQAVVAALPAAALLGGPCLPVPRGHPGRVEYGTAELPPHWVEGLIWDARPIGQLPRQPGVVDTPGDDLLTAVDEGFRSNPFLLDDRDELANVALRRGIRLFDYLVECVVNGDPCGIGYAQFLRFMLGTIAQHRDAYDGPYHQGLNRHVLGLAAQVTDAAGGPRVLRVAHEAIALGLDAFIWRQRAPHNRPAAAFGHQREFRQQWLKLFPDGQRRLLTDDERRALLHLPPHQRDSAEQPLP